MDIYAVILARAVDAPKVVPQYYCSGTGLPATIEVRENGKKVTRKLFPWRGTTPTFTWSYVEPVLPKKGNYSNQIEWGRTEYAKLKYDLAPISGVGNVWHISVGGKVGVRRYTVKATFIQGKTRYTVNAPDHTVRRDTVGDNGISDNVMRVVVKGDYPKNIFLQWVSSFQEVPFILGSNGEYQVDQYIGTDCADLVAGALRKMGKKVSYSGWYADGLYEMAKKGNYFSVVTPKTKNIKSIPEPQPGDIVLWDWDETDDPEDFDHTTVYESGGNLSPGVLDKDDISIAASGGAKKVARISFKGCFEMPARSIGVIRLKP